MKALVFAGFALVGVAASARGQRQEKPGRDGIPAEQRAPKGMCRIWLKDVPAAQQPAPTDCAAAVKNCPPTGHVIFGDTEEAKNRPRIDPTDTGDSGRSSSIEKRLTKPPMLAKKPPE